MWSREHLAIQLFDAGAVLLGGKTGKYGLEEMGSRAMYFDLRPVVSQPTIVKALALHLQKIAAEIKHEILCGVPYTALPITAIMAVNSGTPMIMKRKETKLYATRKMLEGNFQPKQKCLVVEDVVTSGGQLLETVGTLRDEGLIVTDAVVVVDQEQGGASVLKSNGVVAHSLFTMSELVKMLKVAGRITDETMWSREQLAVQLFDAGAVRLGDIEAKVGRRTPIYFDLRVVVSHPTVMMAVALHLQNMAAEIKHDILCGVPYAALPITAVMSVNSGTPMIMKRKETKLYATRKMLEGIFQPKQKCLVVEDVVTSGGSLLETVGTLRDEGLTVTDAVVVLDREQGGASVLKSNGVVAHSIFTMNELVKILNDAGRITDETVDMVSDHIKMCQFAVGDNLEIAERVLSH